MHVSEHVPLAPLTTLRLGGPARRVVTLDGAADVADLFASSIHDFGQLFVLGGGSNLVVRDEGYEGTIVRFAPSTPRLSRVAGDPRRLRIVAEAGASWDDLVALAVDAGGRGMECLAGIPGQVGAAPIQNIGAYGQEVKRTIVEVSAFRRSDRTFHRLAPGECGFAYRHSRFKEEGDWIVCSVTFELDVDDDGASDPVDYPELARALGVHLGDSAPVKDVRATVIELRAGKGMVLDAADPESVSAGSFFVNPVLDEAAFDDLLDRCAEAPPRFSGGPGKVKTSAAWLIERAGFARGYARGHVGISKKHALALVNRGGTTRELLALAAEIKDGVRTRFGVELVREPVLL